MLEDKSVRDRSVVLIAMTTEELYLAWTDQDEELAAFLEVVTERVDGIELFVARSQAFIIDTNAAVQYADEFDTTIHTVHVPPFGVSEPGLEGKWHVELNTYLREILIRYERESSDAQSREERDDSEESVVNRMPKMEPTVATTHPPRFPKRNETTIPTARRRLVEAIHESTNHIHSERFAHIPWTPPTIALENVCPRAGFDYLLTTPEDVRDLRDTDSENEKEDSLAFTCDVGHAEHPSKMLEAMEKPASIHVHGSSEMAATVVADSIPGDVDPLALAVEPANGTIQHLPTNQQPEPTLDTLEWLDDAGHRCPLVIELQSACKTPAVAREMCDWIDDHL